MPGEQPLVIKIQNIQYKTNNSKSRNTNSKFEILSNFMNNLIH